MIADDGKMRLELSSGLPPGPYEVVVVIAPARSATSQELRWSDDYGQGKEIWGAKDAQDPEKEYDTMLEEKSEIIRALHGRIKELEENVKRLRDERQQ